MSGFAHVVSANYEDPKTLSEKSNAQQMEKFDELLERGKEMFEQKSKLIHALFDDCAMHTQDLLEIDPQHDYACTPHSIDAVKEWIAIRGLDLSIEPALLYFTLLTRAMLCEQYGLMHDYPPPFPTAKACEEWEKVATAVMLLHSVPQTLRITLGLWDTLIAFLRKPTHGSSTNFTLRPLGH